MESELERERERERERDSNEHALAWGRHIGSVGSDRLLFDAIRVSLGRAYSEEMRKVHNINSNNYVTKRKMTSLAQDFQA